MANTSFKVENGLLVQGNAQFDYTSKFNANVTVEADQFYIGGNLYVTGAQVFIGGNSAVADILAGVPGLKIGNTTSQFDAHLSNVFVYGTLLNPVGNTVLLGNSTNRWVISGNTLNISTTSTLTGAANALSTFGVTGAANALSTFGVTGAANALSTFGVTGATTLASTLSVAGAANALSTFGVTGAANALSTFGVTGAANALSTFGVTGVATFANTTSHIGAATFSNTLSVTGTSTLTGNATLSGTLQTISGNAAFNSSTLFVDATNNRVGIGTTTPDTTLKVQGTFTANGATTLANTSAHTGSATFANTITVTGNATFNNVATFVGNVTFSNTTTFNNDVLISANLTVTGTRTYVNTQTLDIGDNIVTLNADLPAITAPTENAGIEINRGSSANSRLQWNETTDTWQLSYGSVSTFFNILNEGTTNTNFDSGTLFVDALNNRVGINNTAPDVALRVTGAVDISSTANVQGNANVGGTLGVTGAANALSTLGVNGLLTAAGGLTVTGTANVSTNLNVTGTGNVQSTFGMAGAANALSTFGVNGLLTAAASLNVTGTTNTSAQFNVGGGVATTNGATITNTSILLGNSSVNTQISPSQILIRTTATGNAFSLMSLTSSDQTGGSLTLQHGNTTSNSTIVLGAQAGNIASIELGGSSSAFIDFKTPSEDDFDTRLQSTASGFNIVAGSSTSANVLNVINANVNIDSGTLFVDAVNNRVGINNTAPGVALRVTGAADISSTANVQGNANVGGTLGVTGAANALSTLGVNGLLTAAGGLTVTGTSNVSAQFNVGGGVATTNGATITNTSILLGNSSVNTQISPTQIIVDTSDGDGFTTVTGNLIVVFTSSGTANLSSTTLTIGTTTVNNSQVNSALYTAGLFGVTNGATINATSIRIGNTTSNAIVSGNLISISNTANLTSTTLTIGTTTVNASVINAAAINVVNQTNTATLFVTTSANVGTALTVNSSIINAAANLSMAAYTEKMTALAITTNGTTDLNLQTSSVFRVTVANTVVTSANVRFINPPATGTAVSATLILQYLGTGANSIGALAIQGNTSGGAAGTMKYAYNTQPTLTLTPAKSDILSVITYDGGNTYIVAPSFMNFTT